MSSYRDMLLEQLMYQQRYPQGEERYEYDDEGHRKKVTIDPEFQPGTHAERVASRNAMGEASLGEDAKLRQALGKSKRKRRGEAQGMYSATDYAGGPSPWMVKHGVTRGYQYDQPMAFMDPRERAGFDQMADDWYRQQRRIWGLRPDARGQTYEQQRSGNRARRNR